MKLLFTSSGNTNKSIEKANVLVFGGGNVYHLLKWIKKSGLEDVLPELLYGNV